MKEEEQERIKQIHPKTELVISLSFYVVNMKTSYNAENLNTKQRLRI